MDITEEIISQHFYWHDIREAFQKEVTNCDTCQCKKRSNIKYDKLPAKEADEILWNKLCVDLIGPYVIRTNYKKESLDLNAVTMIDPVTGCLKIYSMLTKSEAMIG